MQLSSPDPLDLFGYAREFHPSGELPHPVSPEYFERSENSEQGELSVHSGS